MTRAELKETLRNIMNEESEYQVFFKNALEKAGKSITDMSDEEKKEFFNKIDAAWDGKGEKNEELVGNQKKLDVDGDGEIEASDLAALRAGIKEVELPKAMIPGPIKAKLTMAIDKIKDTNLSYPQKLQVIGKIIDSLGIDKKELTKISTRIKGTLESVNEGKKRFNTNYGVGKSKYVVNYHDGVKKHKDGSDFFDVQIFKNQNDLEAFKKALLQKGFVAESVTESTINESPSSEEIRIAMLAVNKQKKYRRVTASAAVNDLMNSLEVIARDIKNGKIKDESVNEAKVGDFEMGDFVHFKSANKTGMVKKISGDKVTIMTMKGDFTGDINDIQVLYQDNVNPSVNEEKYTVIDPRGNSLGTADKTQVAMAAKKKGGEKAGYFVVSAKNALKARRALEKFKGDFKNPKLKDMMANLYYESVNESVESVITEQLVPVDKKAVDAFFDKKGFEGKNLNSDGKVLKTVGIGSQEMYIHTPKGVKFVGKVTGKYAQSVVQYVNKNHKSDLSETITEGRAFINAARKAKEEGKTEFEFNGKKYPVTIK